ncbi:MAG: alkylation response protein AidB-like acyl-CoA dehydrogenase, partial [Paracoccaceae bacterium]
MSAEMNELLNELRDSVQQVIDGTALLGADNTIWQQSLELGWLLTAIPEDLDGLGLGNTGANAIHLELGKGLCGAPYLPAMLAAEALCQSTASDKSAWLAKLTGGELMTAPLADCTLTLSDTQTLSGTLSAVQSADSASYVLAWTSDSDKIFLIALNQDGIETLARKTWDQTRRFYDVHFKELPLAQQTLLADGKQASELINSLLAQRDFALAADAIGGASALLAMTVDHLKTRVQFRRPLAMFQSLKHRCADMKAITAASEAMLFDSLHSAAPEQKAAAAKLLACNSFAKVAEESL